MISDNDFRVMLTEHITSNLCRLSDKEIDCIYSIAYVLKIVKELRKNERKKDKAKK